MLFGKVGYIAKGIASASSAGCSSTPPSPTTPRSPAGSTRRCTRCCSSRSARSCWSRSRSASAATACSASPGPGTSRADRPRLLRQGGPMSARRRRSTWWWWGSGPGGEYAAQKLAEAGLDVVGVERGLVGGECPFYGCIPSKMMIRAADALAEAGAPTPWPVTVDVRPDWGAGRRPGSTSRPPTTGTTTRTPSRLEEAGVRIVRGHGRLDGPGRVVVGDGERPVRRRGRGVVLNAGTEPGHARRSTASRRRRTGPTARSCGSPSCPAASPSSAAAPIGAELAQVFARFGVRVTVLEVADRILGPEEPEASERDRRVFDARTASTSAPACGSSGSTTTAASTSTSTAGRVDGRPAARRRRAPPNLADVGLETVGLDPDAPSSWRPTSGCGRGSGSGRSATSPARARSPTCRCTRPPSRCATCSARTGRGPTTARSAG